MLNKRPYRAQYLVQWNARQSVDNPKPLTDKVVEAVLYQQGIQFEHTDEFRSVYSYDKLWEQLEHYDREYAVNTSKYFKHGRNRSFAEFACPNEKMKLKSVSLEDGVKQLFNDLGIKGDKSAGLTAYGESKLTAFTVGLDKALTILTDGKAPAPCLAGVRTQRKGKTRLVWMYPLEMTIIEAVVARPLIDYFKGADSVMTFGDYSHETGMKMRRSASTTRHHYAMDQSQFDSHIGPQLIHDAFRAFRTWFNLEDKIYGEITVGKAFDIIESYFICTPIVMPNRGEKFPILVTGKRGGVPSGSYFTQLVDSFANVALIYMCSERFQLGLKSGNVYVLGDDSLFFCNNDSGDELLQQISGFLTSVGFKVNAAKGSHGPSAGEIEYLGRRWRNGFPIRTMREISRGALYPEKHRRYAPLRGVRQKQALGVVHSYLLTSYVEDPSVGIDSFSSVYMMTPWMSSGYTAYLLEEGLIPGDVLERAVY